MQKQKGVIHLVLPIVLLLAVVGVLFALIFSGVIQNPFSGKKEPKVNLKTEYKNPLNKETQYVNPFEEYKNPFVVKK